MHLATYAHDNIDCLKGLFMNPIFIETLTRHGVNADLAQLFEQYADLLLEVNTTLNLTRITDPVDVAVKHFVDSLVPIKLGVISKGDRVLDVGTGAGFPGMPLAITGDYRVTLLDSSKKKLAFVDKCALDMNVAVSTVNARAEEFAHSNRREGFDVVMSRAVAPLPVLLELIAPLVAVGGKVVAFKSLNDDPVEGKRARKELGLAEGVVMNSGIPCLEHCLIVYEKIRSTPAKYPRRYTLIKSKPLI